MEGLGRLSMIEKTVKDITINNINVLENDLLEIELVGNIGTLKKEITILVKNGIMFNFDSSLDYSNNEILNKQFDIYSKWIEKYLLVNNLKLEESLKQKSKTWIWNDKTNSKQFSASVNVTGKTIQ